MVNLAQIWTWRPLIRPIIHQRVMLEGPESPKSPHKLVLPENISISAFYTVILGIMAPKEAKLVNLAKTRQFWLRCGTLKIGAVKKIFLVSFFMGLKATFQKWTVRLWKKCVLTSPPTISPNRSAGDQKGQFL